MLRESDKQCAASQLRYTEPVQKPADLTSFFKLETFIKISYSQDLNENLVCYCGTWAFILLACARARRWSVTYFGSFLYPAFKKPGRGT